MMARMSITLPKCSTFASGTPNLRLWECCGNFVENKSFAESKSFVEYNSLLNIRVLLKIRVLLNKSFAE